MSVLDIACPDLGGFSDVLVIDVLVKPGDQIALDAPVVTLETDKATMDVPATVAGRVTEVLVARGDRVSMGSLLARVEQRETATVAAAVTPAPATAGPRHPPRPRRPRPGRTRPHQPAAASLRWMARRSCSCSAPVPAATRPHSGLPTSGCR